MKSHPSAIAAAIVVFAVTSPAAADLQEEKRFSDKLFYEGTALMANGNTAEACKKFDQSLALARRGGTLLNLALCREALGEIKVALPIFEEALAVAEREGRADRSATAREHIESIRAKLSPPVEPPPPKPKVSPAETVDKVPLAPPSTPPPIAPVIAEPSPPPAAVKARDLGHGRQIGLLARVDIDPVHAGARVVVGITYGIIDRVEVGASAVIGPGGGLEPQTTLFFLPKGPVKPLLNVGVPVLFGAGGASGGGPKVGIRSAAGVAWDPFRSFGVFAQVGATVFVNADPGYARVVFLPSIGAQGRI